MALVGRREGRNFGYGRQLSYAGQQALKDLFAGGHFATVKAHSDRWQAFVRWCRSEDGPGYNDARQIDRRTLQDYAAHLRQHIQQGELCIAHRAKPPEQPVCACVKRSWRISHDCNAKQKTRAVSTSRTAPKAAVRGLQCRDVSWPLKR